MSNKDIVLINLRLGNMPFILCFKESLDLKKLEDLFVCDISLESAKQLYENIVTIEDNLKIKIDRDVEYYIEEIIDTENKEKEAIAKLQKQAEISAQEHERVINLFDKAIEQTCKDYGIDEQKWYKKYFEESVENVN